MKAPKLSDVYTMEKGPFYWLAYLTGAVLPWDTASTELDFIYLGTHSGDKIIAPIIRRLLEDGVLPDTAKTRIASALYTKYVNQWTRLWDLATAEYEALYNYDMTENHTGTETTEKEPENWTETETQTPTNWKSTTQGSAADNEATTTSNIYGFDSASEVPSGSQTTSAKSKSETEQSGTFETERVTSGSMTDTVTYNTTLTRRGNIGVQTTSDIITKEIELWKWNYFETVMRDIDSFIALAVY